ncbi:hypothetical protein Aasi_0725 [Candidatus Amoebophilus asiaticus 5a2]|uniref:Uncharacterized protein n=1 Tax=Amoebophilus asiaticus (strain 5a2) TaxID=452471 RepID=B3ESA7_AMOA5|nr:hypothetical protein [Candidatus Amoebophilus asiaticus]ACE06109.1 hypothetical protein Aasi_0725 [Candidatus Amoebophilus asiaticus 5a2]
MRQYLVSKSLVQPLYTYIVVVTIFFLQGCGTPPSTPTRTETKHISPKAQATLLQDVADKHKLQRKGLFYKLKEQDEPYSDLQASSMLVVEKENRPLNSNQVLDASSKKRKRPEKGKPKATAIEACSKVKEKDLKREMNKEGRLKKSRTESSISRDNSQSLSTLPASPSLPGTLSFSCTTISDEKAQQIGEVLKSTTAHTFMLLLIRELSFEGLISIVKHLKVSNIQKLILNGVHMEAQGVAGLGPHLVNTKVKCLRLNSNGIGDKGLISLATYLPNTLLNDIDLDSNKIGVEGIKALIAILDDSNIDTLSLWGNKLGEEGATLLGLYLASPKSRIENLNVGYNKIGAQGVINLIANLQENIKLRVVNLQGNQLGDDGFKGIMQALPGTPIQEIDLSYNKITDNALQYCVLGETSILSILNLSKNLITDKGAPHLNRILKQTPINTIHLSDNTITYEGAKIIVKELPQEKTFTVHLHQVEDFSRAIISSYQQKRLKKDYPHINWVFKKPIL